MVEIKASFGELFRHTSYAQKIEDSTNNILASNKVELYESFKKWTEGEFSLNDFVKGRDLFSVIILAYKRSKEASKWQIPLFNKYVTQRTKEHTRTSFSNFEAIPHSKFDKQTYDIILSSLKTSILVVQLNIGESNKK